MSTLRVQQEETQTKYEELQSKVKTLEQENLAKEQEITSLSHKNQLLETDVDKLETGIKEAKAAAEESGQHGTQNESLQRRLQILEEEAEGADRNIRETNEKYGHVFCLTASMQENTKLTSFFLQTTSNRCQGRPLRTESLGSRGKP